jgi:serine kinase of HPr protein (carbohydrate metabolism regulator)
MSGGPNVHASAVLVSEQGVLIRGVAGSGKSSLALALIAADPAKTWLVADDRAILEAAGGRLLARVAEPLAGLIEIRGQGIFRMRHVSPVVVRLVVDLLPPASCPRLPAADEERIDIEGVELARLMLPIGTADAALRVRTALGLFGPRMTLDAVRQLGA